MNIINIVKEYEIVTIFRHQVADQDALGSQFGLKTFLEEVFPDKKIYAVGDDLGSAAALFPSIDSVRDEDIKNSVAFVLDTANSERIDDKRYASANKIVKIDHHIVVEEYAQETYVDTKAAATCEIITTLIKQTGVKPSAQCAKYLYYGLLADSLSFTTGSTTAATLQAAAYLVDCGVDVSAVRNETSGIAKNVFDYINFIRNHVIVDGVVAYAIVHKEEYEKFGLIHNEAKEKVYALADVNEFEIWCLFTEDPKYGENLFNGSLRSRFVAINDVANKYQGGGHKNACGVKKLTKQDISSLVKDLNEIKR